MISSDCDRPLRHGKTMISNTSSYIIYVGKDKAYCGLYICFEEKNI